MLTSISFLKHHTRIHSAHAHGTRPRLFCTQHPPQHPTLSQLSVLAKGETCRACRSDAYVDSVCSFGRTGSKMVAVCCTPEDPKQEGTQARSMKAALIQTILGSTS